MKNLGKRLLSFAMALLMVLSMVPAGALGNHAHATASGNVAEVNGIGYTSLADAITAAGEGDTVKILTDLTNPEVTVKKNVTIDLGGNTVTDAYWVMDKAQVTVENGSIKNTQEPYPLVAQNGATLTINNVAIEASKSDLAIWVREDSALVFNSGSILVTKGENNTKSTISAIKGAKGADITINGGTITVDTPGSSAYGVWANYDDVTVTVNGGKISTTGAGNYNYAIYTYGDITVKDGEIVTGADGKGSYNYALYTTKGNVTVEGGSITTNGNNSYAIYASGSAPQVSITGGEFVSENASTKPALIKTNSSSVVTATIEGGVFEGFDATLLNNSYSSTNTSTVTVKGGTFDVKLADKYIATGATVTMAGTTYTKNEDGTLVEVSYAAKINGVGYTSFADALAAAKTMTGDVVVEIYDKVTLNTALSGSYDSITFVGRDTDAQIHLDVQGYTTATGKKVAFEGLILSKAEGGYVANAGFMNLAFGVYDVVEVAYTNCTFANGAYASSGKVTFTGCTFYRSHDRYGMWAYGDVDAIVDNCTFADFRGIKMYAEGGQKVTNLTVKNSDFSAVNNKPAIVLTHGESVVLENNTYSETGVFELDLDGAPNGTPVATDDVAGLTCKNDNGACGVLVDGKIYTTVAQAAAVAAEGDTIILLHDSAENVELPDGVALDLNGHTAAGITLAGPKGTVTPAYTGEVDGYVRIWGEGGGNAKESYVLKLFAGDKLIATTQLNNVGGIIDGNVYVTWNFFYPASTDEYWTTTWEAGQPNSVDQPTKVELYLDGVKVSENVAKMSGADDLNPVVWENLGGVQKIVTGLKGAGTEADPYLIGCVEELLWFQAKVDEQAADGSTQFAGKYFKLTADIDLAGINWNPIGSMSGDHGSFKGVFDGDGHTIKNLNCQQAGNGIGLFARTAGNAQIKNLTLENVTVKSTNNANYVGGVVGNAYASTKISNVHVKGQIDISGCGYIGGIAGHGYVVMDNVSVVGEGTVYSTFWCAGGILGYAGEGATNITNAHVEGLTITSAAGGLGAIVGMAEDNNGTQPISGANLSAKNVQIKTYTGAYGDAYADYALGYLYGGNPTSKLTGELTVDNVSITTSNGVTPSIVDAVATVDSAVYFDLQSAINAAEGKTVKVLRDITLTEALTVTGTVTLDLAGYDMTVANDAINLHIYGKLTIEDSVGGGVSTYRNHFVHSGAELVVNGGTLQNVETATGGFPISTNDGNATVTINGGTVQAVNSGNYAVQLTATSNLTVNGGTIQGHWGAIHNGGTVIINDGDIKVTDKVGGHCIYVGANAVTTVNGGTYTPNTECASYAVYVNGSNAQVTITDGTFNTGWNNCMLGIASEVTDSMIAVKGGTFSADPAAYCADGYVALPSLNDTYVVGKKPTATVNNLGAITVPAGDYMVYGNGDNTADMPLSFVMQFLADQTEADMADSPYADWYGDFVITFTGIENGSFTADGCYLAGHYGSFGWVKVPVDGMVIEEGTRYPVMLGVGMGQKYDYICSSVQDFKCAMFLDPAILEANPNLQVKLELGIVDNSKGSDAATEALINNESVYTVKDYTYASKDFLPGVAQIGTTTYKTLAEALAAADNNDSITLLQDVTLDYNAREAFFGADVTNITIDGQGHTLTLNQKDSDWSSIGMANSEGKLTLKNMTIEKTGYGDTSGAWNTHAIIFSCNVEMENVTVNNSVAVQNGATLNNVTINEANGYYGLWINGNGQTVTVNGGAINATNGGRGIKIADQYVDTPASVTLNVTDTKFNTAKKAAVLVSSTAGANITASNVDITDVAADNVNFVWVDEDWAANYGEVEVTGATKSQENVEAFNIVVKDGDKIVSYFKTLDELFDNVSVYAKVSNVTVELMGDVVATKVVKTNSLKTYNFVTNVAGGVTMDLQYADGWNYFRRVNIGENVTVKAKYLVFSTQSTIAGTVDCYYPYISGAKVTVTETGVLKYEGGDGLQVKGNGAVLTVNGTVIAPTINVWVGNAQLIVSGANAKVESNWIDIWDGTPTVKVENGATVKTDKIKVSRGGEITVDGGTLDAGKLEIGHNGESIGTVTVTNNGVIKNAVLSAIGSTIVGPEGMDVASSVEGYKAVYENGTYKLAEISYEAEVGGVKYETLAEAMAVGGTVTLLKDVKIDGAILVNNTVVLELSGFSVCTTEKDTNGDGVFHVVAGGDLTINGEGTINGVGGNDFNIAIWADGGKVTINGGYYTNVGATDSTGDTDFDLIYVKNGGEVVINGGKFEAENPAWILNSHDTAKGKISVYGGEFVGFNPMNNAAEGANTNFMADGLHAADVDGDGIYTVHAEAAGETVVENNVAPDCENAGSYDNVVYCEVCGHEMSRDTVTVDALGHSYTNYIYNNNATTSADGTETAACDHGCGKTDTRVAVGTKLEANNVAYIIVDGEKVYYESVQDAIDMAMDGQTVYLNADAREVSLDVYENITLDLNGYTLTVTRQATANGEIKGEGLLAAPKNKTILNGQVSALPVWNGSGYYFAAAPDMSRAMMYNGQFVFQPQLSSDIAALFAAGTADDAALHIVVTLTYELSGKTFTMEYEVTEDTTMDAYKKGKTMGLIIEEDFTNLTFTVKVESDTGAVFSAVTVS